MAGIFVPEFQIAAFRGVASGALARHVAISLPYPCHLRNPRSRPLPFPPQFTIHNSLFTPHVSLILHLSSLIPHPASLPEFLSSRFPLLFFASLQEKKIHKFSVVNLTFTHSRDILLSACGFVLLQSAIRNPQCWRGEGGGI